MPNVSGSPAIDVLAGLFFLYFLLSLVCSSVNEGISAVCNLRARGLEQGIRNLLDGKANANRFFAEPRVRALFKPPGRFFGKPRKPSYVPPRVFALTALDIFAPRSGSHSPIQRAQATVGTLPKGRVRELFEEALDETTTDVDAFRLSIEESFNEVMDRASGWYKRRVQLILFAIAMALVVAINADSYTVGQRLWKDAALRSAVVAQANRAVAAGRAPCTRAKDATTRAAACVGEVRALDLPLGWTAATSPHGFQDVVAKILGLLITAFALTLGAPFWFDLLGKVSKLRSSGPAPAAARAKR